MAIPTWIKPMLHVVHHPTADCLLVTDCGLVDGGTVGVWRVQRGSGADGVWSDRYAIAPADIEPALDPGSVTERGQTHSCWMVNEAGARLLVGTTAKEEFYGGTKYDYFNYHRVFDVQTLGGDADAGTQMMAETGPEGGWFTSPPAPNWTGFTTGPTVHAHSATAFQCVHNVAQASGVAAQGRYFVASIAPLIWNYKDISGEDFTWTQAGGYPQFGVYERDGSYTRVNAMYTVYNGTVQRYPTIAMHPYTYRLYAATMSASTNVVLVYTSADSGLTWQVASWGELGNSINGSQYACAYPSLYCDRDHLWLSVYRPGVNDGAEGKCFVYKFEQEPVLETRTGALFPGQMRLIPVQNDEEGTPNATGWYAYSGTEVGQSDAGRSSVIRDPKTWQLTLVAPKMQSWTGDATAPAIAEYTSADSGSTWTRKDIHSA